MNACAPTDRILQTLRTRVPGVTDDLLNLELFNLLDEFFRRTSAWHHRDQVNLEQGITDYEYGIPSGAEFVRMIGVSHNGIPVPPATGGGGIAISGGAGVLDPALVFPDGDATYGPDASDLSGGIFSWAVYTPNTISINVPSAELSQYPAEMLMVLTVGKGCLECDSCADWAVPDWMWNMYFQDWLDGMLGRLYGMPAKPWASTQHASYHARRFRNAMALRKQETPRGFVWAAPGPWRFPRSWAR